MAPDRPVARVRQYRAVAADEAAEGDNPGLCRRRTWKPAQGRDEE